MRSGLCYQREMSKKRVAEQSMSGDVLSHHLYAIQLGKTVQNS